MAPLIRFKMIVIVSNITFNGKTKRTLQYLVRSVTLVTLTKPPAKLPGFEPMPEIFL